LASAAFRQIIFGDPLIVKPKMAATYSFTVSLRIWHPSLDPASISRTIKLKPHVSWANGELRKTPKGRSLEGRRKGSYWCVQLLKKRYASTTRLSLPGYLRSVVARLKPHQRYFSRIRSNKGNVELFVGVFANNFNFGFEIPPDLMLSLSKSGISLSFDIYG
jgi:hypothetical protein